MTLTIVFAAFVISIGVGALSSYAYRTRDQAERKNVGF
jgi:hypothetical protein